ncbi:MAG TPA: glycosyltransferase family 87 protein [Acidimicrobiales bacterium]|nr:glycosyltransferase family 87 protein [Acidimicrobiales bacterium]
MRTRIVAWASSEPARRIVLPGVALWVLATIVAGKFINSIDVAEYDKYAHAALHTPYFHALPKEYPAPALLIFISPLALPIPYQWALAVPIGIVLGALIFSMAKEQRGVDGTYPAERVIVYLMLGAVMFLTGRYDIFGAAAAFWAVRAGRDGRWGAAWFWSGVGFAVKLFPAALWPVLLLGEWRRTGRIPWIRALWIAGAGAVTFGVPYVLNHGAALNAVHYFTGRPPELGSLAAGLSFVLDPPAWHWVHSFGSLNAVSPVVGPLADLIEVAAGLGCVAVWWRQSRGRLSLEASALATFTLVVLGSKVLSVQYLVWLMPLWALYRVRASWLAACALNSAIFPFTVSASTFGYLTVEGYVRWLVGAYLIRDVILVAGSVRWFREPAPAPPASSADITARLVDSS